MNRRLRRCLGLAGLALALGAVLPAAAPAGAQTTEPIRIAATPTDSAGQVFYAIDRGYFKKVGLDVQLSVIALGASIGALVTGGSMDIATTATTVMASAHAHGVPLVIVAPGAEYSSKNPTTELVVDGSSPIKTAADLTGKTIAVLGIRSITQQAVQAWLDANGGNSTAVKYVEMPFSLMPAALTSKRIDAAFISEPVLSEAIASGARIIGHPYDAIGNNFSINVWFCTTDYAKMHPDIVHKFTEAMTEAGRWANTHHAESGAILQKYTQTNVPSNMVRILYADRLLSADVQPVIEISAKYGTIPKSFPAAELFAP